MMARTKKLHLIQLKVLFALLITLSMIGAVFAPNSVDAATKEYTSYKKLKLGMTATDVAKSLYGKAYNDNTVEYPEKQTSLFYSYRNPTGDDWMIVEFKYDFDQKRYIAQK
ncbi:hypothetical protein [uncultured Exiguobacterium sp.]|uniref:hypothetical protein n=1 Tax=uncultured Exiguobacterium sp. TaxID=202669 RepID=UPI0037492629